MDYDSIFGKSRREDDGLAVLNHDQTKMIAPMLLSVKSVKLVGIRLILLLATLILNVILGFNSWALDIPSQLTRTDLNDVVEILGFPTNNKFLSNPFPLGGYSGFEFGLSTEFINTTDLSRLGSGTEQKSTFQYNRITFGKGLFNDVDLYFHFVPFSNSNEITEYGTQFKWSFYQATYLPFSLSTVVNYNSINFQDKFINEITGWDLLGGINLDNFALYFGFGGLNAKSTFNQLILDTADPNIAINSSGTFKIRSNRNHSFVGINVEFSSFFLAGQIDRFDLPVYSAKIGMRF